MMNKKNGGVQSRTPSKGHGVCDNHTRLENQTLRAELDATAARAEIYEMAGVMNRRFEAINSAIGDSHRILGELFVMCRSIDEKQRELICRLEELGV